jgi:hypothetical protein
MVRERYVPTSKQVDEGFDPGIRRERRGPLRKLREALAPRRVAKHDVKLRDGVGESRVLLPAPPVEPIHLVGAMAADPADPAPKSTPRRARRVRVADEVMPTSPPVVVGADDSNSRVGTWPPDLSMGEIHHEIGPVQNYSDDT